MRYLKELIVVLALFLLIGNASATMYEASVDVYKAEFYEEGNFTEWKSYENNLWIGESESETVCGSVELTFSEPSSSISYGMFTIKKSGITEFIDIFPGEANHEVVDIKDVRLKIVLNQIREQSGTSTGIVADDDDIVAVWIEPNTVDKLSLNPFIPETFDPSEYDRTSGWSGTGSLECVDLYIERLQSVSGVGVTITGGDWDEIDINTDNRRKFELNENGVYVITIDYETVDVWGGVKDETETYTLSVTGLTYGTNTGSVSTTTYDDKIFESLSGTIDKYTIVETAVDGNWEEIDGAVTKFDAKTATGKYSWKIKFDTAGNHKVGFRGVDGSSGYYRFIIRETAPQPAATLVAEQTVTDDKKSSSGTVLAIFGVLILVGSLAVIFNKKSRNKGKGNTGGSRISPDTPT